MDENMQPAAKKPVVKKWWFWLIIVLAVLVIVGIALGGGNSGGDSSSSDSSTTQSATEVTATDLLTAYDDNTVAADQQYKDKLLKISGKVSDVGTDVADRTYITLQDERNEYAIISVQCYFGDDQKDAIAALKKGDAVVITGTCEGKVVNVSVKNCKLST